MAASVFVLTTLFVVFTVAHVNALADVIQVDGTITSNDLLETVCRKCHLYRNGVCQTYGTRPCYEFDTEYDYVVKNVSYSGEKKFKYESTAGRDEHATRFAVGKTVPIYFLTDEPDAGQLSKYSVGTVFFVGMLASIVICSLLVCCPLFDLAFGDGTLANALFEDTEGRRVKTVQRAGTRTVPTQNYRF